MQQFLTPFVVAGMFVCLTSSANASLPTEATLSLDSHEFVATDSPTDTMLAQCYNGYSYAPVYRSRSYYYPRSRGGVSVQFGGGRYGGYRGFPGYGYGPRYGRYGGFGPGFGFGGPGFGRSGVGLFLSF